jgi:hypothetical protein
MQCRRLLDSRCENAYVAPGALPGTDAPRARGRRLAVRLLDITEERWRVGRWLNLLEADDGTLHYTHD